VRIIRVSVFKRVDLITAKPILLFEVDHFRHVFENMWIKRYRKSLFSTSLSGDVSFLGS